MRRLSARSGAHARFVNTAMVATLLGAVSSDQLEDGRVVSGAGGQHDLVAMAHALDGARSIIAVRGTRRQDRRTVSNIVWRYANATVPRQLRDIVVTEYGIADLRGKSDRDCVAAMLGVADSRFQPAARGEAQRAGKLEAVRRARQRAAPNTPERHRAEAGRRAARRPAARVPARHRDDRGGAGAGRRPVRPEERGQCGLARIGLGGLRVCAIGDERRGAGADVLAAAIVPGRPGAANAGAGRAAAATR